MAHSRACRLVVRLGVVGALLALLATLMQSAAPPPVAAAGFLTDAPPRPAQVQATDCASLVVNGGFETGDGWRLAATARPAGYVASRARSGGQALRLGIEPTMNDGYSESAASQSVTIPASTTRATLVFWAWRGTEEAEWGATGADPAEWTPPRDRQEALVLDRDGRPLAVLLRGAANDRVWLRHAYDLTPWRGQTVSLYFNVLNTGTGGRRTWLYLDDVSLETCQGTEPPSTATPPPPVAQTDGCAERLLNGGFETDAVWQRPTTAARPEYTAADRHTGERSLRLGVGPGEADRYAHSAAYQAVTIPATATRAVLSLWVKRRTQAVEALVVDGAATPPEAVVQGPGGRTASEDYQEALVLDHRYSPLLTLFRSRVNSADWERWRVNLLPYRGQRVVVYLNAFNDGDGQRTWLSVDDVGLEVCGPGGNTPVGVRGQVTLQGRADYAGTTLGLALDGLTTTEPLACDQTGPTGAFQCEVTAEETTGARLVATHPGYLRSEIPLSAGLLTRSTAVELVAGDVNGDCQINLADLVTVSEAMGSQAGAAQRADLNGNGAVDVMDVVLVGLNYNRRCPTAWPTGTDAARPVP